MKCNVEKLVEIAERSKQFHDDILMQMSCIYLQDWRNLNKLAALFTELDVVAHNIQRGK